jgi:hypothetical protein
MLVNDPSAATANSRAALSQPTPLTLAHVGSMAASGVSTWQMAANAAAV